FSEKINNYPSFHFLLNYDEAELILGIGIALAIAFTLKFIFLLFSNYFIISFSTIEQAKIQKLLVYGALNQKYENFLSSKSGDNLASISNFSGTYREVLQAILQTLSNIIVIVAIFIFLGFASLQALLILSGLLGAIFALYNLLFSRRIHQYGSDYMSGASNMIQGTTEISNGLKEIKTLGKENFFIHLVSNAADIVARSALRLNFLSTIPKSLIEVILIFFIVFTIALNIDTAENMAATISILGIFAVAMIRVGPLVSQVQTSWNTLVYGQEPVASLAKIIKGQENKLENVHSNEVATQRVGRNIFDSLELTNICYRYPEAEVNSIDNISFKIEKGDFIGLIGPSGAGKTSLINVMLGFLKAGSGSIKFNRNDIHENIFEWREHCAYLPQDIFLLNDSLRMNIALDKNLVDTAELIKAVSLAKLSDFVKTLPDGLDTNIGDRGVRLSGGQKQRVAIARAIFHKREILFLDESTSALDAQTEKDVMKELVSLKKEKTIIAIAHRITTLKECNKIYKLDNGKLSGPFSYSEISINS
ncbi:ABC transporter ATP-binding protein/permease, partial [Gammaproteobacteria bacterium]|nr:ABC transporter ATP-binding protein/permease [Gammaproteobacteria bacterium]